MHKRTLAFPPLCLSHITADNALYYKICSAGINKFLEQHHLTHLTAIPVTTLLNLTTRSIERLWIKTIAGHCNYSQYSEHYGIIDLERFHIGFGGMYGDKNGDGNSYHILAAYGRGNRFGSGSGDEDVYGKGFGYGYGYGHGYGYADGYGTGSSVDDHYGTALII